MLVVSNGNLYRVDMASLRKKMFEPMPMIIEPPAPDRLRFFRELDFMPKIMESRALIVNSTYEPESKWKFFYLFPLGRKAYIGPHLKRRR